MICSMLMLMLEKEQSLLETELFPRFSLLQIVIKVLQKQTTQHALNSLHFTSETRSVLHLRSTSLIELQLLFSNDIL